MKITVETETGVGLGKDHFQKTILAEEMIEA